MILSLHTCLLGVRALYSSFAAFRFFIQPNTFIKTQALFCRNAIDKKITVSALVINIQRSNKQIKVNKDLEKHIRRTASYVLEFIITYSPVWMEFQSYNANTALMFDVHVKCGNLFQGRFRYYGNQI